MNRGDAVKVNSIWAGGRTPERAWFGGYVFEREDSDDCVLVKITEGTFAGQLVRYHRSAVRLDTKPENRCEFE